MFKLETARLWLLETPTEVIAQRIEGPNFYATVDGIEVYFPEEWPGDPLDLFPGMLNFRLANPNFSEWGGIMVEKASRVAVGGMGFKGPPRLGTIEMGYGVNPSYWGKGFATEMALALSDWVLGQPEVRRVFADCLETNIGSRRVLEKSGFKQIGQHFDADEGGVLLEWEKLKAMSDEQ